MIDAQVTVVGLDMKKHTDVFAASVVVHPVRVVSVYFTALESAGIADAAILDAEAGPVYDAWSTVFTSMVIDPVWSASM